MSGGIELGHLQQQAAAAAEVEAVRKMLKVKANRHVSSSNPERQLATPVHTVVPVMGAGTFVGVFDGLTKLEWVATHIAVAIDKRSTGGKTQLLAEKSVELAREILAACDRAARNEHQSNPAPAEAEGELQ